jgi:hypothetical protein
LHECSVDIHGRIKMHEVGVTLKVLFLPSLIHWKVTGEIGKQAHRPKPEHDCTYFIIVLDLPYKMSQVVQKIFLVKVIFLSVVYLTAADWGKQQKPLPI